jgi:hypothetical protein
LRPNGRPRGEDCDAGADSDRRPPAAPTVKAPPGDDHSEQRGNRVDRDDEQGVRVPLGSAAKADPLTRAAGPYDWMHEEGERDGSGKSGRPCE